LIGIILEIIGGWKKIEFCRGDLNARNGQTPERRRGKHLWSRANVLESETIE